MKLDENKCVYAGKNSEYSICSLSDIKTEFKRKDDGTTEIMLEIVEEKDKSHCVVTSANKSEGSIMCDHTEINRCYNKLKALINETLIEENNGVVGIEYKDIKDIITNTGVYNSYCIEYINDVSFDLLKNKFENIKDVFKANDNLAGIIMVTGNIDLDEFESIYTLYGKTVTNCYLVELYPKEISNEITIDIWTMEKRENN